MLEGLARQAKLKVQAKTGATGSILPWALAGAVFALVAIVFLSIAAYNALAMLYGGAIAALIVGVGELAICGAMFWRCAALRQQTQHRAVAELAVLAHQPSPWRLDPSYIPMAMGVVRSLGWRKIVPLVAAGALAVGLNAKTHRRPNGNAAKPH
jgi:hypothetical protein